MSEMPAALYKYLNPDRTAIDLCRPRTYHTTHPGGGGSYTVRIKHRNSRQVRLERRKSTLRKGLSQRETIPTP
jgi:hypothetical protein